MNGLRVVDLGSAGPGDISEMRLWRDGGDGVFGGGAGDDRDLGPLALLGGVWQSPFLSEPLGAGGARLFVSLLVGSAPIDSSTVRLEVPLGGIVTASGNSGPIDSVVVNPETQVLTLGPLIASLTLDPSSSTP